jgi:hypothetical protein
VIYFIKDEDNWKVWSQRENRVIFAIVNRLLREKDYTTAIQLYSRTLQKDPNDPYLLSALGRIFFMVFFLSFCFFSDCWALNYSNSNSNSNSLTALNYYNYNLFKSIL